MRKILVSTVSDSRIKNPAPDLVKGRHLRPTFSFHFRVLSLSPVRLTTNRTCRIVARPPGPVFFRVSLAVATPLRRSLGALPSLTAFTPRRRLKTARYRLAYFASLALHSPTSLNIFSCVLSNFRERGLLFSFPSYPATILNLNPILDHDQTGTVQLFIKNPLILVIRPTPSDASPAGPMDPPTTPVSPAPKPSP